jgi:hypothetical protein
MDTTTTAPDAVESQLTRTPRGEAVVIADAGNDAWIVVRPLSEPTSVGTRFSYRGETWEIRSYRPHVRAWVAEPVRH